jgi:PD-(D/E)XK endonuclease
VPSGAEPPSSAAAPQCWHSNGTKLSQKAPTWHILPRRLQRMDDLTPSQKGAVAEAGITSMVIQLGLTVLRPLCEGRRYDLVVDLEPELLRVQCKLARRVVGVLSVRLKTNRLTPAGYVLLRGRGGRDRCLRARAASRLPDPDRGGRRPLRRTSPPGPSTQQPGPKDQMGSRLRARMRHRTTASAPAADTSGARRLHFLS